MPFSSTDMQTLSGLASNAPSARDAVAAVRQAFPGVTVTRVDAMDMRGETPVARLALCDIFLVDTRNHCWTVTADPAAATGVVLCDKT